MPEFTPGRAAPKQGSAWFYKVVRVGVVLFSVKPWRVRIIGREHIPTSGAVILAPSHRSMLDITWATAITRRRLRFMGKSSAFRIPLLGIAFRALGGFAVERDGSDVGPLRDALAILATGDPLLVFPEGSRQHGAKITELQPGAAYLAIKGQVPVVPIGMAGSEEAFRSHGRRFPRFGRGVIVIGPPLAPPAAPRGIVKRSVVDEFTLQLHDAIQTEFDEAYRQRA